MNYENNKVTIIHLKKEKKYKILVHYDIKQTSEKIRRLKAKNWNSQSQFCSLQN